MISAPDREPVADLAAAERSSSTGAVAATSSRPLTRNYFPSHELEVAPVPKSAPHDRYLDDVRKSGLPIRVRVLIDADGLVASVTLLSASEGDDEAAQAVIAMFRDTAFTPGRRRGGDVPSFLDLEVVLEPTPTAVVPFGL